MCCFFFKQKTAYEMRISDWSSDVCSSDLLRSGSACRFRQFGNESQRNAQLVELVMRAQECDRLVGAGLARDLRDFDACLAQRPLRLGFLRCVVVQEHVLRDPVVEEQFDAGLGGERSEEHTSELQSLMRISYAVFCLKKNKNLNQLIE